MNIKALWNYMAGQRRQDVPQSGRIYCEAPYSRMVDTTAEQTTEFLSVAVPIAAMRVGTEFVIELALERQSALITKILIVPCIGAVDKSRSVPLPGKGHIFPVRYRAVMVKLGMLMVWLDEGVLASRDCALHELPASGELKIGFGIYSDVPTSVQLMGVTVDMFI